MRRPLLLIGFVVISLVMAGPAEAQRIEITPFAGFQFDGELDEFGDETTRRDIEQGTTWGLMLDVNVTSYDLVELYYSSQGTELNRGADPAEKVTIDYLQVGAIHEYSPQRPVSPYVGLTLGATRIDVAGDSDTRFSAGITLGAKMIVSDHLGFRFDGRVFGTSTGSGAIGCSDEVCFGYPDTSIIWQYAVNAGVIIHFGS
jgi:hypothetical protein